MTSREFPNPVTFYLDDATHAWLSADCAELQMSRSGYLRNMVEWWRHEREAGRMPGAQPGPIGEQDLAISRELTVARERARELEARLEGHEALAKELAVSQARITTLEGDVRALEAERDGMGEIINIQRERQGMSDSLNQELTQTLNRITLILPAPGESSGSRGFNWRFWQRPS